MSGGNSAQPPTGEGLLWRVIDVAGWEIDSALKQEDYCCFCLQFGKIEKKRAKRETQSVTFPIFPPRKREKKGKKKPSELFLSFFVLHFFQVSFSSREMTPFSPQTNTEQKRKERRWKKGEIEEWFIYACVRSSFPCLSFFPSNSGMSRWDEIGGKSDKNFHSFGCVSVCTHTHGMSSQSQTGRGRGEPNPLLSDLW